MQKEKYRWRIAYLQHGFKQPGGGQYSLLLLLKALDKKKFNPVVVNGTPKSFLEKQVSKLGIETTIFPLPVSLMQLTREEVFYKPVKAVKAFAQTIPVAIKLASWLKKQKVDLVHTDDNLMRLLGGMAAKLAGIAHVAHVRDIFPNGFIPRLYWKMLYHLSDSIIAVSKAVSEQFDHCWNTGRQKIHVIYNAIDVQNVREALRERDRLRSVLGITPDTPVIAMFGRLVDWKGHRLFLLACKQINDIEPRSRFWIVGDGPLMQELQNLAASLDIKDKVSFFGFREDALNFMAAADIIVNYSTKPDPFPRVVIEAMALGRVVVGPSEGGIPEALGYGKYGVLVEPRRPEKLAEVLIQLLHSQDHCETLGRLAQRFALMQYHPHRHAKQIETIYSKLLQDV